MSSRSSQDEKEDTEPGADFETAIAAAGFGKFNFILFLLCIPAGWTLTLDLSSMSYVFPIAQCDLNLSSHDKALLNAITYIGMVSSALIWGFFTDVLGRKKLLVVGFLISTIISFLSGFSQNLTTLLVFKFFGGFVINGPYSAIASYLSEIHSVKYRSRIQMAKGAFVTSSSLVLPFLAWAVLPAQINIVFNDTVVLRSWNVFLMILSLPYLISFVSFCFLPESPKFLMTKGQNEQAMKVFKMIYNLNNDKSKQEYPINRLAKETEQIDIENKEHSTAKSYRYKIVEGLKLMKPLLSSPHRSRMFLICCCNFGLLMGLSGIKLWLPQIFTSISQYQSHHNGSSASLCEMLGTKSNGNSNTVTCEASASVYTNSLIVASSTVLGLIIAGYLINYIEKKKLFIFVMLSAGICISCLYFARDATSTTILSSLSLAQVTVGHSIIIAISIDVFPTNFRAVTVATALMMGRLGPILGHLLFPYLLEAGCLPVFGFFGIVTAWCGILALFLPRTHLNALK